MEMGHGVAMGTVFGTKENVNQNQSIKLDQSKMILILKVLKGQLISKGPFADFTWTKKWTK